MLETYTSPLAAYFYVTESWFTPIDSRGFILTFVVINIVLCSTAIGFFKGSEKERCAWRHPSTYPMFVPVIGHLLLMAWDSSRFISAVVSVSLRHTDDLLDLC